MFNQDAAGVALADGHGVVLSVNDRFCAILGRPREQLLGVHMADLTHPDDRVTSRTLAHQLRAGGENFAHEKRYLRGDGTPVWAHVAVSLVRPEGEAGDSHVLALVFDITQRKAAEEELRAADRRKDEFLAMLAHELRNPLAPIGNAAQLLRLAGDDPLRVAKRQRDHRAPGAAHDRAGRRPAGRLARHARPGRAAKRAPVDLHGRRGAARWSRRAR